MHMSPFQVTFSPHEPSWMKADQAPSRPAGVAVPLPAELPPEANMGSLEKSGTVPSSPRCIAVAGDGIERVDGGWPWFESWGDMSNALGASVALMPSKDRVGFRGFEKEGAE